MKRKEIKNLAQKIVKYEKIIRESADKTEVKLAQVEIMNISNSITSLEDMVLIDEMVQELLSKNK